MPSYSAALAGCSAVPDTPGRRECLPDLSDSPERDKHATTPQGVGVRPRSGKLRVDRQSGGQPLELHHCRASEPGPTPALRGRSARKPEGAAHSPGVRSVPRAATATGQAQASLQQEFTRCVASRAPSRLDGARIARFGLPSLEGDSHSRVKC